MTSASNHRVTQDWILFKKAGPLRDPRQTASVRPLLAGFIFLFCSSLLLTAGGLATVKGSVFQSKGGDAPLLIWDATPAIVDIVNVKPPRDAALHKLESDALAVAFERLPTIKQAKNVTVRLIYQKIGAVNPEYGSATLAGVERLFELSVDVQLVRTDHDRIAKGLEQGSVPPNVHLRLLGQLPPYTSQGTSH